MASEGYPREWEADVLLRDGHPVHVRPIAPQDGDMLRTFHAGLSARTVYLRFFSAKPVLTDADVAYFTQVDHHDRVALIALDAGRMVGVGRYDRLPDGSAEVAFVIDDAMQGQGLGSVLLEHLVAAGRERGVQRFVAEVLPENTRMLNTFREAGFGMASHREADVLAVSIDLEPTDESRAVMQSRERRAEARSVERLLHPSRVAVVGASRRSVGLGHALLVNLQQGGFAGELVAVHPEAASVAGVPAYPSLSAVDGAIDLAVVAIPAEGVLDVVRDAAASGVHGLVIVSGGFGDAGPEGARLQGELVSLVHQSGMRLVGPNALGLINTDPDVSLNASLVADMPLSGAIGFFCQSGALGGTILARLRRRGLGVSTFVSAGNRADISGNDLLQYWDDDEKTRLVLLYLETIGNARKFARVIRHLAARKPVAMVRAGGPGVRHPAGHLVRRTALSQQAVDQVLGAAGLIVVDSIHQLLDVATIADAQPLPRPGAFAVVGNSDAIAVLAVNAIERAGLSVSGASETFRRDAAPTAYERAVRSAMDDASVGAVVVIHVPPLESGPEDGVRQALLRCMDGRTPVVLVTLGSVERDPRVPTFPDVEDAVRALAHLSRHADWRREAEAVSPEVDASTAVAEVLAMPVATADGHLGVRIRLLDDPQFGHVVSVGLDDPVAEALDARAYRIVPVSPETAEAMIAGEVAAAGGRETPLSPTDRTALARAVSAVSRIPECRDDISTVDLRAVRMTADGRLTTAEVSVAHGDASAAQDPTARRLDA